MKVMVIGSGGREHAISWTLAKSHLITEIVCVPGNGGTATEAKCRNVEPAEVSYLHGIPETEKYAAIARHEGCTLAVVGPEDPLAAGVADTLWNAGIPTVGPKAHGAALEASKDVAKRFMHAHRVACAASETFSDAEAARAYIKTHGAPIVVKADGLAAGKGVVVAATVADALNAVDEFMGKETLGAAGKKLVIEEYLQGVEISVLAAVSVTPESAKTGKACIVPFVTARDHKRLLDGAKGPNTGGMGAVAPVSDVTPEQLASFDERILKPTLDGMIAERMDYRGFIFFGLMLTADGPKLLEYNVRLGDPETQAVLPLMDFDFAELCRAITNGTLKDFPCTWKPGFVCAPVAVSGGYPHAYKKNIPLTVTEKAKDAPDVKIFIAGAKTAGNVSAGGNGGTGLVTSGGRVLAASAYGETFEQARRTAYETMAGISFEDMFYRTDIGLPGAAESGAL